MQWDFYSELLRKLNTVADKYEPKIKKDDEYKNDEEKQLESVL